MSQTGKPVAPAEGRASPAIGPRAPVIRVFDCHVARSAPDGSFSYLLLQRASHKIYAGSWRMVGGKLRPEETAWQACLREIAEETQLTVARLLSVPYVNRFYEWQHDRINDIPVFVAVIAGSDRPVLDDEHCNFEWLSLEGALARLHWPGQREGLVAADALLRHGDPLHAVMEIRLQD